jgi:hypothetical protein
MAEEKAIGMKIFNIRNTYTFEFGMVGNDQKQKKGRNKTIRGNPYYNQIHN